MIRVLLALLVLAAPAWAAPEVSQPDGYRMDDYNAPVPDAVPGGQVITTPALQALVAAHEAVLVDVLPAPRRPPDMRPGVPWLPQPRRDIPGSLWLPEVGRGAIPPDLEAWMQRTLERVTGGDHGRALVFYCRPDCWMSWNAAKRASALGWRRVLWYPDGAEGWANAGLPLVVVEPEPAG